MANITITITECKRDGRTWTSTHRTDDSEEAIARAVRRHFGRRCSLYRDSLQATRQTVYGQVGYYLPANSASTMVTGTLRIDIDA